MIENIFLAMIPVFVAVDPIGILPIFISLAGDAPKTKRREIIVRSLVTATTLALGFIILGKMTFQLLGISVGDFMIAGGAILFCIAIIDLINPGKMRRDPDGDFGVVPIGTPLVVGPAVLTTCLIIVDQYGVVAATIAVVLNILLVGVILYFSDVIMKFLGPAGTRALSKIMALFLAAIAVMMVRKGVFHFIAM